MIPLSLTCLASPGPFCSVSSSLFPDPVPKSSREHVRLAYLPPATSRAKPVCSQPPLPLTPFISPLFHLSFFCHPPGCLPLYFLVPAHCLALPGTTCHPFSLMLVASPLFHLHHFCPGMLACSASSGALESRAQVLFCFRLGPS